MEGSYSKRRFIAALLTLVIFVSIILANNPEQKFSDVHSRANSQNVTTLATKALAKLETKGRAPKTGYDRNEFGSDWSVINGCSMRNIILDRDLVDVVLDDRCNVTSGILNDPYSGKTIIFNRGRSSSTAVQIDHVVALSDAWQKGAQKLSTAERIRLANDPLELLAVDGNINMQKGDGDAATWLPPNKSFRCQYIARQIAVKIKYKLWVTSAERDSMTDILSKCPDALLPRP